MEIRRYKSFDEDFAQTKNQDYKLEPDYKWLRLDFISKCKAKLVYGLAIVFSSVYCRVFLHLKIKGSKSLKLAKDTGGFIFGNHTQPVGDVFNPALAALPKRIYTIVSSANLGIPVLGRVLPYLGALPIADSVSGMKKLNEAIDYRLKQKALITIYPEAHVWEYCSFIRPFDETAFKFPVKFDKPSFCMTATYQKRRFFKKPRLTLYIDGPYYCDKTLSQKEQAKDLKERICRRMCNRSLETNCEYIKYEKI